MGLRLHDYELDAGAYKARLMMSLLGLAWTTVPVDVFPGAEHRSDAFLAQNPLGALPVLEDGDLRVSGAEAVLVHLAAAYGPAWIPTDPAPRAAVHGWLAFSGRDLAAADEARLEAMLGVSPTRIDPVGGARAAFRVLDHHLVRQRLGGSGYLAGAAPTIADIACFPAVALAIDFQEALEDYPALRAWSRRIRALPGFRPMPGIPEFL